MELGLSALSGPQFLLLFAGLLVLAIIASVGIGSWLRQAGQGGAAASMEELAVLSGGRTRFAEAVTAKLFGNGSIEIREKTGFVVRTQQAGETSAERAVLGLPSPARWKEVTAALHQDAYAVRDSLVRKGWMVSDGEVLQLRLFRMIPFLPLLTLGAIRLDAGLALDEPVGFLTILLIAAVAAAAMLFFFVDAKTEAGARVLKDAEQSSSRLKRAPLGEETGQAVALYGTAVLAGTAFVGFHAVRNQGGGDAGGSTDSDGGDGGCGGGGCGGCGG